ncbi:MAG: hypothetical protein UU48_C0004G0082 [Candidatus Uhrbacteria bacterium GW2011_GWF2_41_16]|uniref:Uncharacterized protein n=1 Tax=Candidatus Uhrbacteria bacterium GW2011_GWF2_41_16 TaxID=1618997 RepID=A0A0G0VBM2_9BACT|nr:MAG: hypothetical protein UU48_C0004G0082 [Candidatus Uhrbacteria bacterium GW2011_GWF2_41_16]
MYAESSDIFCLGCWTVFYLLGRLSKIPKTECGKNISRRPELLEGGTTTPERPILYNHDRSPIRIQPVYPKLLCQSRKYWKNEEGIPSGLDEISEYTPQSEKASPFFLFEREPCGSMASPLISWP